MTIEKNDTIIEKNDQILDISELDPVTTDLEAPVPKARKECIDEICNNFSSSFRYSAIKFWRIGYIISELQKRGEKNVVEELMDKEGYEKRYIQYTMAVYKVMPDPEEVKKLCVKGMRWTHFRHLASIKQPEDRKQISDKVLDGSLDPIDVPTAVQNLKQSKAPPTKPITITPAAFVEKFTAAVTFLENELNALEIDYENMMNLAADEDKTSSADFDRFKAAAKDAKQTLDRVSTKLKFVAERLYKDVLEEEDD